MHKRKTIPTILGIVVLLAGVFAGVFLLNMNQVFKIGADTSSAPKNIRVSNISDTSTTISWTTDKEVDGFVSWGVSQGNTGNLEKESSSDQKFQNHTITLKNLNPSTNYFYKIGSGGTTFDNGGIPWQFLTGAPLGTSKDSTLVSGSVINASGQPEKRALVYVTINGYLMSTITSDTGNFVIPVGQARSQDLKSFTQINKSSTLLEISVQGISGVSSAQIYPQSANPIPPMVLGKVYDFKNLAPGENDQNPNVNLNLPQNSTTESKFNVSSDNQTPSPTSVILENVQEGETISTDSPQFFGKGPGGEEITITLHSEVPVTDTVNIPSNGSWSWSPPSSLSEGSHTITISWKDTTGITRSLTRNFVVQASEVPAFTASDSGTISTPTASPTGTPTAKLSATPTPTPKPTIIATPEAVPQTGSLTPTLALSIMGVAVMLFSIAVWKNAQSI